MSDNVVSLSGIPLPNATNGAQRDIFMETVAQAFDRYIENHGEEPEAIVFTLSGLKQTSVTGWHMTGESQGGVIAVLSQAAVHLMLEVRTETEDA